MLKHPIKEEFEWETLSKLVHKPTGAWVWVYPSGSWGDENMLRAGARTASGDDYLPNEVRQMAVEITSEVYPRG
jgi:hypothetical protein